MFSTEFSRFAGLVRILILFFTGLKGRIRQSGRRNR